MARPQEPQTLIIFDGHCNACNSFVSFILKRKNRYRFSLAASESEAGKQLLKELNLTAIAQESVVVVDDGRVFLTSSAILKICQRLGLPSNLLAIFYLIPNFLRDFLYKAFARNRYRLFGKREQCRILTEEERNLFLR